MRYHNNSRKVRLLGTFLAAVLLISPTVASADTFADIATKLAEVSASLSKIISSVSGLSGTQQAQVAGATTANGSQTFTAVGPVSFTVPSGVTSLKVTMAGGGGGGSGGNNWGDYGTSGGGGGGYNEWVMSVTPGQIINGSIGGGGAGGAYGAYDGDPTAYGGNGGNTTFGTLIATGGQGGQYRIAGGVGGTPGGIAGGSSNGRGGDAGAGQGVGSASGGAGGLYGGGGSGGHTSGNPPARPGAQGWIKIEWVSTLPTITSINPTSGEVGDIIAVLGKNFLVNTTIPTVEFLRNGQIVYSAPPMAIATNDAFEFKITDLFMANVGAGTYQVRMRNGNGTSNLASFTVNTVIPTITVLSPNGGETKTSNFPLWVTWTTTNFASDKQVGVSLYGPYQGSVPLNQYNLGNVVNSGSYMFNLPPSLSPGLYKVYIGTIFVKDADSASDWSNNFFTISNLSAPTITSINPLSGVVGTSVTLTGTGFMQSNTINLIPISGGLNGQLNVPSSNNGTSISFNLPNIVPGKYYIEVGNENGSSNRIAFPILQSTTPTITMVSPVVDSILAKRNTELKWAWSSTGSIPTVDVILVTPSGQPLYFAKAYPNYGSFWWAVGFANTEWNQNIPNGVYTIAVCPAGVGIDFRCGKFNVTIYGDTPIIGIVYPTGGETFQIGGQITVSFSGVRGGEQYKIDLLQQEKMTPRYPLGTITGISADLSKNILTIPSNVPAGIYTVQVTQLTNQGTCINACAIAESKPFTITATVSTPAPDPTVEALKAQIRSLLVKIDSLRVQLAQCRAGNSTISDITSTDSSDINNAQNIVASTSVVTVDELQKHITLLLNITNRLNAQISTCQNTPPPPPPIIPPLPTPQPPITIQPIFTERNLYRGMKGDGVRKLQELLAKDPQIYPSGEATGYYGFLTQAAVQNFQCKYNIICAGDPETTGYGVVGPKTMMKINEVVGSMSGGSTGSGGTGTTPGTSANTVADLQAQIKLLMEQVNALSAQLKMLQ